MVSLSTLVHVVSSLLAVPSASSGANQMPEPPPRSFSFVPVILTPFPLSRLRSSFWLNVLMILSIAGFEFAMITLSTLRLSSARYARLLGVKFSLNPGVLEPPGFSPLTLPATLMNSVPSPRTSTAFAFWQAVSISSLRRFATC